jgi:hypothetical protein
VGVTDKWAKRVIDELLTTTGQLKNPGVIKHSQNISHVVRLNFTLEEEVLLLALQTEWPYRPNMNYVAKLKDFYNQDLSASAILVWFKEWYDYAGT